MASLAPQSALPLRIQVLEGDLQKETLQANQPPGRIELTGRELPFRPMSYEGRQRVKTRFYPGNPVATTQVIGPTEEPTTFTGAWHDVFQGDGAAQSLRAMFENLRRRGPLLEVSWGDAVLNDSDGNAQINPTGAPGAFVRRGHITRTKFSPERPQDIGWEIDFAWIGTDDSSFSPLGASDITTKREGALQAVSSLSRLQLVTRAYLELAQTQILGISAAFAARIDEGTTLIGQAIDGINAASDTITSAVNISQEAIERLIGSYAAALQASRNLRDVFLQLPLHLVAVTDEAADVLGLQRQRLTILAHIDVVTDSATSGLAAATAMRVPTVIAEIRPSPGTDLRDLARQFYGDPDLWPAIARFNGLPTSAVPMTPDGPSDDSAPPIRIPRQDATSSLFDPHLGC